jgi:hypothetical protein
MKEIGKYKSFLFIIMILYFFSISCSEEESPYWGDRALIDLFTSLEPSMISSISVRFSESELDEFLVGDNCWDDFLAIISSLEPPVEIGVGEWQHHGSIIMQTNAGEIFTFTVGTRASLPGETIVIVQGGEKKFDHLAYFLGDDFQRWLSNSTSCL